MSRRSNRVIRLPCFGITVRLDRNHTAKAPGAGTVTSKLKGPEKTAAEWLRNAATAGLESLILAHARAGVDVKSPACLKVIEMAVEAITNRFD